MESAILKVADSAIFSFYVFMDYSALITKSNYRKKRKSPSNLCNLYWNR